MRKIVFIGTGYVGLVSGVCTSEFGHDVTCVDIDQSKINDLNQGRITIYEPELEFLLKQNVLKDRLKFSSNINEAIKSADIIFIAVGTPQTEDGQVNLSAIEDVAKSIGENLNQYKVVCTKSTVPVGTGKKIESIIK